MKRTLPLIIACVMLCALTGCGSPADASLPGASIQTFCLYSSLAAAEFICLLHVL